MSGVAPCSESQVPRKRARIDVGIPSASDEHAYAEARQDEEFWMDDGNVDLFTENVKFRVYRGLLTEHSPLFMEMLSLPQPATTTNSVPHIRLHDHPEDWRHLLRLLLPRKQSQFTPSEPTFDMISAYVRLAHKYQMDSLLEQWMGYLKDHFTNSFDIWALREQEVPRGMSNVHAIGVVNLARLTGYLSILPTALSVCTLLQEEIVHGFTLSSGVREQLSPEDLGRCFKLKGALIQANAQILVKLLSSEEIFHCEHGSQCRKILGSILAKYTATAPAQFAPDGLAPPWKWYDAELQMHGVCTRCRLTFCFEYRREQQLVWIRLPETLGIEVDGWGED